jgi:hypothetical protein
VGNDKGLPSGYLPDALRMPQGAIRYLLPILSRATPERQRQDEGGRQKTERGGTPACPTVPPVRFGRAGSSPDSFWIRRRWAHARAARIMRELHPPAARNCCKTRAKPLGMVLVRQSGFDMKLRGIIFKSVPELLCPRSGCSFLFRTLFFPFDRCRGFL